MDPMRNGAVILLLAAQMAMGQSPAESSSVCDRFQHSDLIFTGTAQATWITMVDTRKSPVHRRREKSKRVRFLVREWYKGDRRPQVEVWIAPSECSLRVETDQTYLIYAHVNRDKNRFESDGCRGMAPVADAAADIRYLTAAQLGPAQATHVSGTAGGPNLNVQAKSGINTRYAVTDAKGQFAFNGLAAGDWSLGVVGGESKPAHVEAGSCVDVSLQ